MTRLLYPQNVCAIAPFSPRFYGEKRDTSHPEKGGFSHIFRGTEGEEIEKIYPGRPEGFEIVHMISFVMTADQGKCCFGVEPHVNVRPHFRGESLHTWHKWRVGCVLSARRRCLQHISRSQPMEYGND